MAAVQGMRFIPFVPPNPSLSNRNKLRSATVDQSIPLLTSCQKRCRPAAVLSRSGRQSGAERYMVARPEGWEHALANNDDGSDDDLPSLEELLRIPPSPTISDKASRTEPASQHLDQPALNGAIQADRTKSETGERQGDSSGQSMTFDDESEEEGSENEAEDGAGDIEMGHTEQDASPQSTFKTSDLISRPTKSVSASGPWFDVEEGRFIDEPELFSIFPPVSKSLPDHSYKCVGNITTELAPHSLTSLLNGNDGWTDDSVAELEAGVELALSKEVNSSPTSASIAPRHSVDPPQDETNTRAYTETTSIRPEELQGASLHAIGFEKWEQQRTKEINPLPRSVSLSSPSSPALFGKAELGNPVKRGRKDTYRETSSERLLSAGIDDAYANGDEDQPPAKRRKSYGPPTLIAPPHFRRSRWSVPPLTATSLEMDETQPHNAYLSTYVDDDQQYALHAFRESTIAMEHCSVGEDEELDELAMDEPPQQEYAMDSSDDSADEDYSYEPTDGEDEDLRPIERSKLPSPPHRRHRAPCIPTQRGNVRSQHICHPLSTGNKQLCSPQNSQSPSPLAESLPLAEYQECAVNGVFKYTRIGNDTTFNLELQVADFPEHFELVAPLKAMSSTLAAKISPQTQIPSRRHVSSTHSCKGPPRKRVKSFIQPQATQRPVASPGALRKEALSKRRTRWTEEDEATVVNMRKRNASWKEISVAVPSHSLGSITGHYYGTLCKRT